MSTPDRVDDLKRSLALLQDRKTAGRGISDDEHGREGQHPGEIPPRGWRDILWRTWSEVSDQNLFLIAGGVTYAIVLALFPGLAALVSLYGLVFNAGQIEEQVTALSISAPIWARWATWRICFWAALAGHLSSGSA